MSDGADRATGPDAAPAHLQRTTRHDRKAQQESEQLDRLLGDSQLLLRLQLHGYADEEWQPVATEFARYGLGIISSWLWTGRIYAEVLYTTGTKLRPHEGGFAREEIDDLATDTVVAALGRFLDVLKENRWDPTKGASLKTYFIGQCKWQFLNVYKKWVRQHQRPSVVELATESWDVLEDGYVDQEAPADQRLLAREQRDETLAMLTTHTARQAFTLVEMGYSHEEVAEQIGVADVKAVENLLGYQRRHVARLKAERKAQ